MRNHNHNRKFGRPADERRSLLRGLAESLILHERILTTSARAKEVRSVVERLVTYGKKNTLASRRLATAKLHNPTATKKLFDTIAPRYTERAGGYTRIVKVAPKAGGDGRESAYIEFV